MDYLQNVMGYFDQQQPLCAQHDKISKDLYQEYGVKAGLRDENGKGVLAGLTNISDIRAFEYVDGVKRPADGQLLYRGYDVKDLINGSRGGRFAFEEAGYLLLFGELPTPEKLEEFCRVLGECRYFRAYIYLCLVTRFGDVPVLRQNTQAKVSRDPASMAWELVEEDLDAASGFLNGLSADSFYYVSPAAVTALKARVKLYLGKKGEAKELAESLITNPNYALDDFDKIFRSKANKEVIFAFSCLTEDGSSIKISNQFYSYNHPNKGSYNYRPAGDVMTMYADNVLRKEVSITTLDNLNFVNKYPSGQTGSDPVVISRLAEMYLISAEAQGLNGGLDRLNELREKRGLDRVSPGNEADFLDAVLQERRLEFLAEGFRWYDLVRTGKATQTLGTKDYQCLMPLPSRELLYNPNLKPKNPGY